MTKTGNMVSDLESFKVPFKQAVLQHILHELGKDEWARLRQLSQRHKRYDNETIPAHISPEELLDLALEESGLSINETLIPEYHKKAIAIAKIQEQPVYYLVGMGIYIWGECQDSAPTLQFWATYPAYPPGW